MTVRTVPASPTDGQQPGASGLRRKTREFILPGGRPGGGADAIADLGSRVCKSAASRFGQGIKLLNIRISQKLLSRDQTCPIFRISFKFRNLTPISGLKPCSFTSRSRPAGR